jgi:hypothetical protein
MSDICMCQPFDCDCGQVQSYKCTRTITSFNYACISRIAFLNPVRTNASREMKLEEGQVVRLKLFLCVYTRQAKSSTVHEM